MSELYDQIAHLCRTKKISITTLCKETAISRSTLSELKAGRTKQLSAAYLERISNYFGVSIDRLLGKQAQKKQPSTDQLREVYTDIVMIPLFESVSAGFGAHAEDLIVDYVPLYIPIQDDVSNTLCIRVNGDSMYPKIEHGDIVQVRKQASVDSGSIAVVLIDDTDAVVKKVTYGADWVELISLNPEYQPRRFEGEQLRRLRVLGLVQKIIKECC